MSDAFLSAPAHRFREKGQRPSALGGADTATQAGIPRVSDTFLSTLAERLRGPKQRLGALGDGNRAAARTPRLIRESCA